MKKIFNTYIQQENIMCSNKILLLIFGLTTACCFVYFMLTYESIFMFSENVVTTVTTVTNISEIKHFVIHSAFYYNVSKLYTNNSMIILFNAHREFLSYNINFQCFSKNQTSNFTSPVSLRSGDSSGHFCLWRSYFANCTTVENPQYFGLITVNSSSTIEINFEYPEQKEYPVAMCYPPMLYESRWQQIIFATEIYHYFGAHLQIQYINSAMSEIVEILVIYEKKEWIKIRYFAYLDFDAAMISLIGYHPMLELDSRNQALGYTDCLMKYRESSDFVIVADLDDILIPKMPSYNQEFLKWSKIYPNASSFIYYRVDGNVHTVSTFNEFSFSKMFLSYKVQNISNVGKSVYQTRRAEMAWIHWPGIDNITTITIPPANGTMYHTNIQISSSDTFNPSKSFKFIPENYINEISLNFSRTFKNISNFKSNSLYADVISKCYDEILPNWEKQHPNEKRPCLSPLQCEKPKSLKKFKCKVAKRKFSTIFLNQNIVIHVPNSDYYLWSGENGCDIFLK